MGFMIMAGPQKPEGGFNAELFSFRRITLSPLVILISYGGIIFLIFQKK